MCQNVLIVVDGPSLVATILSCKDRDLIREQGAIVTNNDVHYEYLRVASDLLEGVSDLVYKKWRLDKQQNTTSIACISKCIVINY